jgi:flagellar hook-length control protein FliK
MMEAIGQKAVIPVIDEAVAATEFGMDSGENGENKVFDATLEQMLAELPLDEKLLEELLDEDGLSASLNSVLLTQNQLEPEIADTDFGIVNNSNMPLDMLADDLWSEDVSSLQTQVLKKSTPISAEMIEVLDPRFTVDGSKFDVLPVSGIAETGLQSLLGDSTAESTDPLLQAVFHQVKPLGNGAEISVQEQQQLSRSTPLAIEEELSTSDLQSILQKTASQSVLAEGDLGISKSELPPELQPNSNQKLQGNNVLAQDLSSILENQQNLKRGDVPLTPEQIKAAESLQVVEKFKTNDALQTTEKFQVAKEFQSGTREKAVEGLQTSEKFQLAEEFKSGAKTKLEAGFQATEKFKLAEELQSGGKTITAENLQKAGVESTADASAKVSEQTSNQFRTLTVKDTQLSGSSKSSADTVSPAGMNSLAEVSGTSMVKGTATNTSAEPLRGADLPFNMEQVVSRVRILRGNGVEEMTLRLHPEDLGQITVKIRQSGAELLIDMRVDNPQAKLLVEAGFDALRSKFLDQEFSYQDLALNVDINERDSQFSGDRKNYKFEEDMNSAERGKNEEIAEVEETPRVINRNDSGLNLYV